jgi:hypothetical protein
MAGVILFGFNHAEIMVDAAFTAIAIPLFAQQGVQSVLCERMDEVKEYRGGAAISDQ